MLKRGDLVEVTGAHLGGMVGRKGVVTGVNDILVNGKTYGHATVRLFVPYVNGSGFRGQEMMFGLDTITKIEKFNIRGISPAVLKHLIKPA
jgi:hypothetical protein